MLYSTVQDSPYVLTQTRASSSIKYNISVLPNPGYLVI